MKTKDKKRLKTERELFVIMSSIIFGVIPFMNYPELDWQTKSIRTSLAMLVSITLVQAFLIISPYVVNEKTLELEEKLYPSKKKPIGT